MADERGGFIREDWDTQGPAVPTPPPAPQPVAPEPASPESDQQ